MQYLHHARSEPFTRDAGTKDRGYSQSTSGMMTAALEVSAGQGHSLGGKWLRGHHRVKGSEAKMGRLARNGSKQKQHAETWEGAASQGAMGVPGTTAVTADVTGANLWEPSWWTGTGQGTVRSPWWKGHSGGERQIGGGKFGSRGPVRVSCRNWGEP